MASILPASLVGQEIAAAMLRSTGEGVIVNGSPAPSSAAIFSGDFIETQKQAVARIEATGSSANIDPETMVTFEDQELVLDHGSLAVFTGRGLRVRVGCISVTPVNPSIETTYEVLDREVKSPSTQTRTTSTSMPSRRIRKK
jgi:hypothetical protein